MRVVIVYKRATNQLLIVTTFLIVFICVQCKALSSQRSLSISRRSIRQSLPVGKTTGRIRTELRATSSDSLVSLSSSSPKLSFEFYSSIQSIPIEKWNACLSADSSPFLEHSWLSSLEESGCASPETGWAPQHISLKLKKSGELCGFVPLYIKGHSMGEFIFDNAWAEAASQSGIPYYPKLLVAVPFTPVAGDRILLHPSFEKHRKKIRRAVASFLIQVAQSNNLSSVHFNFCTDEEATDLTGDSIPDNSEEVEDNLEQNDAAGKRLASQVQQMLKRLSSKNDYMRRISLQYHWTNVNPNNQSRKFLSFEDYLSCFKSKRRITIRRERRRVLDEEGIRIQVVKGEEIRRIPGLVERMFAIYTSTVERMVWGRKYLTLDFFQELVKSDFCENICFFCATRSPSGSTLEADNVFAGTFNIVKNGVFYGRYWGCLPGQEVKNLHFEICYWSTIDFCIQQGLRRIEPGAGGGDYKWARGFDPALIHSSHYICHPGLRRAVRQYLEYETDNNVELTEYLSSKSAVKNSKKNTNSTIESTEPI